MSRKIGYKHNEESKIKMSISHKGKSSSMKGKKLLEEIKRKISDTLKRKFKNNEIIPWQRGLTKETSEGVLKTAINSGKARKGKFYPNSGNFKKGMISKTKGMKMSEEFKKKCKERQIRLWKNSDYKKMMSNSHKGYIQTKEVRERKIKATIKGLIKRPTSFEKIIINIIDKYNLPYKYVGDGSFLIGYKNPDFINTNGEKICIEVYLNYFKERDYNSVKNYEEVRSNHFNKYGWKTIFINEEEIEDEEIILEKIKGGNKNGNL